MPIDSQQSGLIRRYLLDQLAEEERERFEAAYMEETPLFFALLEEKERLIDRYLRNELSAEEDRQFERVFFSSGSLRREVELRQLARNFSRSNPGKESTGAPWWQAWLPLASPRAAMAWAAALLLLVLGGNLFRSLFLSPPGDELAQSRPAASAPTAIPEIELDLASPVTRSARIGQYRLDLDASVQQARLRLRLAGKLYSTYHGDIRKKDEAGRIVASNDALLPEATGSTPVLVWTLETRQLPTGDYSIEVQGIPEKGDRTPVGSYDLNVRWR